MTSRARALELMQAALDSLRDSGMLEDSPALNEDTVLLGAGSPFDSMGFVTFITELEDRLNKELGRDVFFVIDDIDDFDINNPHVTAAVFARYMGRLSEPS